MKKFFLTVFLGSIALTLSAQIVISPKGGGGSSSIIGGTCTNQAVTAIGTDGTPTCTTITSAYTSGLPSCTTIITSSSQVTADFTSISGAYTNLKASWAVQDTASGTGSAVFRLKVNNDGTSGDYATTLATGYDNTTAQASAVSPTTDGIYIGQTVNAGNTSKAGIGELFIPNYSNSTYFKVMRSNTGLLYTSFGIYHIMNSWNSTSPITRLTFKAGTTAFTDNSMFRICLD